MAKRTGNSAAALAAVAGLLVGTAALFIGAAPAGAFPSTSNHSTLQTHRQQHSAPAPRVAPGGAGPVHASALSTGPNAPTLSIFAGNGTDKAGTPGPATKSAIGDTDFGIAFDAAGNTYLEDDDNDYVYKVTAGGTLSIFAGNGTDGPPTPGPATHSSIGDPEGLAFDKAGNLYIADDDNDYVYKVTPAGTLSIFAGNGGAGPVTSGPARSEPIGELDGLAFDPSGNLYVVSYGNDQVYKVTPGGTLSVFAGIAGSRAAGTPGPAKASAIGFAEGLATDSAGNVYIVDDDNDYVYKVTPGGQLSIFAGDGRDTTPIPGPATASSLGGPEYVATDSAGDVYVTDDSNDLVYKVTSGRLSIFAGIFGSDAKGTPGPAAESAVGEPEAIGVNALGDVFVGDVGNHYVYKITVVSTDRGYWMAAKDGGVFSFGDAHFYGSEGGKHLDAPIVGMASTPSGNGYWLVASDGGVFSFGDAVFYGSEGGKHLAAPIVGMAVTPSGNGYWLVASDGGVFSFGDAHFYGSEGGKHLAAPIVGMAASPNGNGYWLVASDGGIFSLGATFYGSTGATKLAQPMVGMAAGANGHGYWLVAKDGGIFTFGPGVKFYGSEGGKPLAQPVVGMASTPDGLGYQLVAADGGLFDFGDAHFYGSEGGKPLVAPVVGMSVSQ